jgi:hypothetical protein
MEQYIDLMGASATAGAQAVADTTLLLQAYLICLVAIIGALIIAWRALVAGLPYSERSQRVMALRLWERISAACAADRAGCWAAYRGSYRKASEREQDEGRDDGQGGKLNERSDEHRVGR